MPFLRRRSNRAEPVALAPVGLPVDLPSGVLNGVARELNAVLPESALDELSAAIAPLTPSISDSYEHERALTALDWVTRTWFGTWCQLVPETGEALAAELRGLVPIHDDATAAAVGNFVAVMAGVPEQNAQFIQENYSRNDRFESIALDAAEKASAEALGKSVGPAIADLVAPQALREYRAARADDAIAAVTSVSLGIGLDELWPFVMHHLNLPGEIDAKAISIRNLAPYAASRTFEPIVQALQASVGELFVSLAKMG